MFIYTATLEPSLLVTWHSNEYSEVLTSKKLVLFNGVVRKREDNLQVQLFKAKEL